MSNKYELNQEEFLKLLSIAKEMQSRVEKFGKPVELLDMSVNEVVLIKEKEIDDFLDSLIQKKLPYIGYYNMWNRIEDAFKRNDRAKPYLEKSEIQMQENNCQSLVTKYIIALDMMLERIEDLEDDIKFYERHTE